jgi:hypothetical protein
MPDLDERFRTLKRSAPPDLWPDIEGREPRPPRRAIPWDRLGAVAVALVVAAAGVAFAYQAFRVEPVVPGNIQPSPSIEPTPLPPLTGDPTITAEIPLPRDAVGGGVAVGAGSVWLGVFHDRGEGPSSVLRIDLSTNEVIAEIPVENSPSREQIVATDDAVWVGSSDLIERIDPATNTVVARIDSPGFISAMASDATALWAIAIEDRSDSGLQNTGTLLRVDPATNTVVAQIGLGTNATGYEDEVEIGSGAVWVLGPRLVNMDTEDGGDLVRVDPMTNEVVATVPVDGFHMVVADDAVWVVAPIDGLNDESGERWHWSLVDLTTNEVSRQFRFEDWGLRLVTPDSLWSVGYDEQLDVRVTRFDPDTLEVEAQSDPIRSYFTDAVVDARTRTIWVSAVSTVVRIDIV